MEGGTWMRLVVFLCLLFACNGREIKIKTGDDKVNFNHTLALILAEYASAVYTVDLSELFSWTCARCNNMTTGFEVMELIVDIQSCLQAYVGVAPDPNAIIIAIRGTQENSVQNWIEDFVWQELDLKFPDMPGAMVHRGLYGAYNNTSLRPAIVEAVKRIRESYGELPVMATGHSMGGALVAFSALDLVMHHGIKDVHLMTYGQPRIGNAAFASCFYNLIPDTFRIVHNRDIVAHLPPYYSFYWKSYHHFPREVWLHDGIEQICDESAKSEKKGKRSPGSGGGDEPVVTVTRTVNDWKGQDLGLNQVSFDESTMPAPVCSCTGKYRQCYKWGNGGWQSSCCTTKMSMYPLPVMPNKRHARMGGRKMSGTAFQKLLSRLAAEGHDLSMPVDLKDHWAKHGTNRYITIK